MKESIRNAYERMTPDDHTRDVMLQHIQMQARAQNMKIRRPWKQTLTIAACVALVIALSGFGVAAYQKWSLPEPKTYTQDSEKGIYRMKESQTYAVSPTTTAASSAAISSASSVSSDTEGKTTTSVQSSVTTVLTDEDFIQKALEILQLTDLEDVNRELASVVHQDNLYWGRGEVEVYFTENENITYVKFQEDTGALLGLSSINWIEDGTACNSAEEMEALAVRYYEMLPVTQGYVLTDCEQYDKQYWSFSFCREVQENVYSQYEAVKINVNPLDGRLVGCTVFSVPLLDDHETEDIPLTAEEAEKIARACERVHLEKYQLKSSEIAVVLPNWWYTDKMAESMNAQSCDVTRLAWHLTFENPNSEFADMVIVDVDYYTGEILGGDAV